MDLQSQDHQTDIVMLSPTSTTVYSYSKAEGPQGDGHSLIERPLLNFEVSHIMQNILRRDTVEFFAANYKETIRFWSDLLTKTTLPWNILQSNEGIAVAFKTIETIINDRGKTVLAYRLAHAPLSQLLSYLQGVIASNRRQGRLPRLFARTNNAFAIDIYLRVQQKHFGVYKRMLHKRVQLAKQWVAISGAHPLLLVTFTKEVKKIIYIVPISHTMTFLIYYIVQTPLYPSKCFNSLLLRLYIRCLLR